MKVVLNKIQILPVCWSSSKDLDYLLSSDRVMREHWATDSLERQAIKNFIGDFMKIFSYLIALTIVIFIVLGAYWLIWNLWCYVLGYMWVDGPVNLINPDYWPFAGMLFLSTILGKMIFGRKSKE